MKQKLWVVTELYYPELTSTGYYLTKIAEGLANDFDVKVLCGQPNYLSRGTLAPSHEILNGVEIFRLKSTRFNKNVIPLRLINMLTLSFSVLVKGLFSFSKGDKVLVVTTPPSLPFITALCSLLKGSAYTLLIHDNYPEVLIATGKAKKNSFIVKLLNFFNRWLYKYANRIIAVGRDMKTLLEAKTKGLDVPVHFIPNWAELETVGPRPREENQLLNSLNLNGKFVFLYAGNMGYPNDVESIIKCAEKFKEDERFHFIFLGTGSKRKWIEEEVAKRNLQNVNLLNPRPRSEQIDFLNACDVAIVSLVKGMWGVSVPSRTYNILAAGKPILALVEKESEVAMIVEEEEVGWVVEPNNPDELYDKVLEIYDSRNELEEMSKRARKAAVAKYCLENCLKSYREIL